MSLIRNPDALQAAKASLGVQSGIDQIPEQAVLTIDCTPRNHRVAQVLGSITSNTTGTKTALNSSANFDVFLSCIEASMIKDATCDVADGVLQIQTTINGATVILGYFSVLTTTADSQSIVVPISPPLKIDRSAPVNITGSFTAGKMVRSLTVYGYQVLPQ